MMSSTAGQQLLFPSIVLSLLLCLPVSGQTMEVGTFNATSSVVCRLTGRPPASGNTVASFAVEFRTSHANNSALLALKNNQSEQLALTLVSAVQISVQLAWLPASKNDSNDTSESDGSDEIVDATTLEMLSVNLTLGAAIIGDGEWHRLDASYNSSRGSWQVTLDDRYSTQMPSRFTGQFAWNNDTTVATLGGGGFRGCLANASLDGGAARLPLHAQSELLNSTANGSITVDSAASQLPGGGSGCRQDPCPCLPNGDCVYSQWNLLQRCNCSRGYLGEFCQNEWDTCQNLLPGQECLNGGLCSSQPGPDAYRCSCTPAGHYLGSRCQSFNHCKNPSTCQNGANCSLTGDPEKPSELDYRCTCTDGFTGRNCTVAPIRPPDDNTGLIVGITIGLIAVLLLLIAAFVAVKVIRDRRRDSGAYKPSQRETNSCVSVYADQDGLGMQPVMRPPHDERFI